jgi:hypothetical protein
MGAKGLSFYGEDGRYQGQNLAFCPCWGGAFYTRQGKLC